MPNPLCWTSALRSTFCFKVNNLKSSLNRDALSCGYHGNWSAPIMWLCPKLHLIMFESLTWQFDAVLGSEIEAVKPTVNSHLFIRTCFLFSSLQNSSSQVIFTFSTSAQLISACLSHNVDFQLTCDLTFHNERLWHYKKQKHSLTSLTHALALFKID